MYRDNLSFYLTRGKRCFGIAIAVTLLGLGTTVVLGQEEPPGDMAQQAALAAEQAYKLVQANKLDEARQAYAKIVTDYLQPDYAIWDSAITAMGHVLAGDDEAAGAVIEQMVQEYSANPFIAKVINKIGDIYRDKQRYNKALELYQKVVDTWPQAEYAVWAQKSLASTQLKIQDNETAQSSIDTLLANYTEHEKYRDAIEMLAHESLSAKKYVTAWQLNQYLVSTWPRDDKTVWAHQQLAICQIRLGHSADAQSNVADIIANYSSHKEIAKILNRGK